MRIDAGALHRIASGLLVTILVVVLTAVPLGRPAYAVWTPNKCDLDNKYWCFATSYEPISGGVTLNIRYMLGSRNGGYQWWQRYITQDWRFDYSFFYFLGGWAPGAEHYNPAPWESDHIYYSRSLADEGIFRGQYRGRSNVSPYPLLCDGYIDWHVYNAPGHYWQQGPYGCLTPQY